MNEPLWPIPHTCIEPGKTWAECLCDEIDPDDRPCVVCEAREDLIGDCPGCRAAVLKGLGIDVASPDTYLAQVVADALKRA